MFLAFVWNYTKKKWIAWNWIWSHAFCMVFYLSTRVLTFYHVELAQSTALEQERSVASVSPAVSKLLLLLFQINLIFTWQFLQFATFWKWGLAGYVSSKHPGNLSYSFKKLVFVIFIFNTFFFFQFTQTGLLIRTFNHHNMTVLCMQVCCVVIISNINFLLWT